MDIADLCQPHPFERTGKVGHDDVVFVHLEIVQRTIHAVADHYVWHGGHGPAGLTKELPPRDHRSIFGIRHSHGIIDVPEPSHHNGADALDHAQDVLYDQDNGNPQLWKRPQGKQPRQYHIHPIHAEEVTTVHDVPVQGKHGSRYDPECLIPPSIHGVAADKPGPMTKDVRFEQHQEHA